MFRQMSDIPFFFSPFRDLIMGIIINIIIDPPRSNNTGSESTHRRRDISLGAPPPITCLCRGADKTSIKILTNTSTTRRRRWERKTYLSRQILVLFIQTDIQRLYNITIIIIDIISTIQTRANAESHFSDGPCRVGRQTRVSIYQKHFRVCDTIFKNKNK